MARPPRDQKAPLLNAFTSWRTTYVAGFVVAIVVGAAQWEYVYSPSEGLARAAAMTTLVITQCLYVYTCRTVNTSALFRLGTYTNLYVFGAILFNVLLQIFLVYTPHVNEVWGMADMPAATWGRVLLLSFVAFLAIELEKGVLGPKLLYPCAQPLSGCFHAVARCFSSCCTHACCRIILPVHSQGAPTTTTSKPSLTDNIGHALAGTAHNDDAAKSKQAQAADALANLRLPSRKAAASSRSLLEGGKASREGSQRFSAPSVKQAPAAPTSAGSDSSSPTGGAGPAAAAAVEVAAAEPSSPPAPVEAAPTSNATASAAAVAPQ